MMDTFFDPDRLPPMINNLVRRAFADGQGYDQAISAIEDHLDRGGARTAELLVALALVLFEQATQIFVHEVGEAATRAIALLEEARDLGLANGSEYRGLLQIMEQAQERQVKRERHLRSLLFCDLDQVHPHDLVELAHLLINQDHDMGLAAELFDRASRMSPQAPRIAQAG